MKTALSILISGWVLLFLAWFIFDIPGKGLIEGGEEALPIFLALFMVVVIGVLYIWYLLKAKDEKKGRKCFIASLVFNFLSLVPAAGNLAFWYFLDNAPAGSVGPGIGGALVFPAIVWGILLAISILFVVCALFLVEGVVAFYKIILAVLIYFVLHIAWMLFSAHMIFSILVLIILFFLVKKIGLLKAIQRTNSQKKKVGFFILIAVISFAVLVGSFLFIVYFCGRIMPSGHWICPYW